LGEIVVDTVDITNIEETTFRTAKNAGEILDCLAFSRSVNYWIHFFDVVLNELENVRFAS
jgi:hypothetical protein